MPNSSNHMQFWLALLAYRVDTEQRSRIWNGYLAWKLPGSLLHEIRNVGNPPFNQFALGQRLQLTEEEKNSLDALADSYGGHPLFSDPLSKIPTPYMDFSGHSFDVDVCFSGRILINASFKGTKFNALADFRNATFVGTSHFEDASFERRCRFDGVAFENTVYFKNATFRETTVFDRTEFKVAAYFDACKFISVPDLKGRPLGGVGFRGASFSSDANFEEAIWSIGSNFEVATFRGLANFKSTSFEGKADFQRVQFERAADFSFAEFERESNFNDASFKSTTHFRSTSFLEPPKFFETDLHEDTDFDRVDWHRAEASYTVSWWSKYVSRRKDREIESDVVDASSAIQAWDRLALVMSKLEKLSERHNFYRLRMRAQRKRDGWGVLSLSNWLFDVLSDYGWSIRRALIWWSLHFTAVGLLLFSQTCPQDEGWGAIFGDSLLVSFSNAHAFLGLVSDGGYLYGSRLRVAAAIQDIFVLNAVGMVQTVTGPILLFLLLLTLRNRFRLR